MHSMHDVGTRWKIDLVLLVAEDVAEAMGIVDVRVDAIKPTRPADDEQIQPHQQMERCRLLAVDLNGDELLDERLRAERGSELSRCGRL